MNMHDVLKEVSDNCGIELKPVPYNVVQPGVDCISAVQWGAPFRRSTEKSYYDNLLCVPLTQFMTTDEINSLSGLLPKISNDGTKNADDLWEVKDGVFYMKEWGHPWLLTAFADPNTENNKHFLEKLMYYSSKRNFPDVRYTLTGQKCDLSKLEIKAGMHMGFYKSARLFKEMEYVSVYHSHKNMVTSLTNTVKNLKELSGLLVQDYIDMNNAYDRAHARISIIQKKFSILKESR